MRPLLLGLAFATLAVVLAVPGDLRAAAQDPAARGLDLFLELPATAAPGSLLPVQIEAFGYATATRPSPLPGATVEAGWDEESLSAGAPAPASVQAITDGFGRARLLVPVPMGPVGALALLVGVRYGAHSRTRTATVARQSPVEILLATPDTRVVPGSTISAWVRATNPATGLPRATERVTVELFEGDVALRSEQLETDAGGVAVARIAIPHADEQTWTWTLRARDSEGGACARDITLSPRDETPGAPTLSAGFEAEGGGIGPGETVKYTLRLRDPTGHAYPGQALRLWVGHGKPPERSDEKHWLKASTEVVTDGAGEVHGTASAPTLVKATGTSLSLVVHTLIMGHSLDAQTSVAVGAPSSATAEMFPEATRLVPGLAQHVLLRVLDEGGEGVATEMRVAGDGLRALVTTDAHGEADVVWNVPLGVGAGREVGPCAGGVAAGVVVTPTREVAALRRHPGSFSLCLPVDRDAGAILRADPLVAHAGDRVRVTVARTGARHPVSILALHQGQAVSSWIDAGADAGDLVLPADAGPGRWDLTASAPEGTHAARTAASSLFVVPKVLPLLEATRTGGRAAPGGTVEVALDLTDSHGAPLAGTVSAVLIDAYGGGSLDMGALDEQATLCGELGVTDERCNSAMESAPSLEALRRAMLGTTQRAALSPSNDPGGRSEAELSAAFADVVKSLEGAVYQATSHPDALLDVRRRESGRWLFNPELITLTTDAMSEPPETPGGEPLTLPDLIAVDPQVTFDNVARRVTRLKLFQVLAAVRAERRARVLDADEPTWRDPAAFVRRLVQSEKLTADQLVDPWGGTLQFVRSSDPATPFLSPFHGYELRSPGPDGVLGTTDDVKDPFERVLRSGSPYAKAVDEDAIVDAKWDMEVSDETVNAWQATLQRGTGTALGQAGVGEGGGGGGSGIGLGSMGTVGHGSGYGRASSSLVTGDAYWSPPVRTDARGRVRLSIPLGDVETTWKIGFVGVADGGFAATRTLFVPCELPLSATVDTGASWTAGDVVVADVAIRNRSPHATRAHVSMMPEGVAELAPATGGPSEADVDVPAGGLATAHVRLRAPTAGTGALVVDTRAAGLPSDHVRHTWQVAPAGERRVVTEAAWVDGARTIAVSLGHGYEPMGPPAIVLERGYEDAVAAALDSLEPERQSSPADLVDALDGATRVRAWALTRRTPRAHALAVIAETFARHAIGRHHVMTSGAKGPGATASFTEDRRLRALAAEPALDRRLASMCPPEETTGILPSSFDALEAEPPPSPEVPPCWAAYVADVSKTLAADDDGERIARAILALGDHPFHAALVQSLAGRLAAVVRLDDRGNLTRPPSRPARAIVYSALLYANTNEPSRKASAEVLSTRLAALRDATGGYGSARATLAAVKALLTSQLEGTGGARVEVSVDGGGRVPFRREVDVPEGGSVRVALPPGTLSALVRTRVEGPRAGVLARLEVPVLRSWAFPPPPQDSPVQLEVSWPTDIHAGGVGLVRVSMRQSLGRQAAIDASIPLPPGASMAAPLGSAAPRGDYGARQVQGVLAIRWPVADGPSVAEIPVRFGLAGALQAPEASARIARESYPAAWAPSSTILVR